MAAFKYINKLQDKRVLIFGGTSGIGYAVAEAAIEHGANVILSGSKPERLLKTVQRIQDSYPEAKGNQIETVSCDLSQLDVLESELGALFKTASNDGANPIDHVVYSAGDKMDVAGGITGTDLKVLNSLMAVRVYAPTLIAKVIATTDYVNKSAASSFTITSGTAHLRPRPTWSMVSMVSGALQGLVSGLALDLAPVRVNVVNPGFVQTELLNHQTPEILDKMKAMTLTKKLSRPEDIAEAYLYFMKDSSADGTSILSDNGKVLSI